VFPDDILEREVLDEASRACDALVERVRARVARNGLTATELGQFAASALEAYCDTVLRALLAIASRRGGADAEAWVRQQFHEGLDRSGTALRGAVADSPHRHTVAQRLQQGMFEAEMMLRGRLRERFSEATPRVEADSPVETRANRMKAAG